MYRVGEEELDELRKVFAHKGLFRVGDPATGHLGECDKFEREWAAKIGVNHALLTSGGGTAALVCALVGLGIGPGDEVIVPAYTWLATATAVLNVGAIPVLTDVDETLALDPEDVERKAGEHTRAIIPVHMCGRPAALGRLVEVARRHGMVVIEDCCQADGGSYKCKRLGSYGDAGAYSFNDFKLIGCGEGGGFVTNDRTVFERALVYHDSGANFRPFAKELSVPVFIGMQIRASEVMGAMMRIQLQRLDGILSDLRRIRRRFEAELGGVLPVAPNNDLEGDCGVVAAFQFDTEASSRCFAVAEGVRGWLPIDSDKHVYTNWTPLRERRIMHHPDLNPFNFAANRGLRMNYEPDACPRTLEYLRRTVFVSLHPDWTEDVVCERIAACRRAA